MFFYILLAITAGILLGVFAPAAAAAMKPFGEGFIKLIKMIIAPVIFCTVVLGIAGAEDLKKVGRTGGLALVYFEAVSTLALILGLCVVHLVRPGAGMNVNVRTLDLRAVSSYAAPGRLQSTKDFILNLIPTTFVDAFARGEILQVLLLAVLFGIALQRLGARHNLVLQVIDKLSEILFAMVRMIMYLAPLGAFGAMAFTIGSYGLRSLASLAWLMGCFYLTCLLFIFGVLGLIARLTGFSILRFLRYIGEELLIVLGHLLLRGRPAAHDGQNARPSAPAVPPSAWSSPPATPSISTALPSTSPWPPSSSPRPPTRLSPWPRN